MVTLTQVKEKLRDIGDRTSRFIGAIGGKIDGLSPLPPEQTAAIRRRAAYCTAFTVLGFLFESTAALFGSRPYGIALLLCAGHANTFFIWLGELAGVFVTGQMIIPRIVILTLILFTRYALSGGTFFETDCTTFGEPLKLRMILCVIFGFLSGICRLITEGLSGVTLSGVVACALLAPLLCAAFRFAFDRSAHATLHEAGIYLLLFVLISSLRGDGVPGISLALILSVLLILHTGLNAGLLRATLVGLICGIACGDYGVIFAVSGLAAGAMVPFGTGTAVFVSGALAIGIAVYTGETPELIRFTGDVIFASLLFLPLYKSGVLKKLRLFGKDPDAPVWFTDPAAEKSLAESRKRKFAALSSAFDEISDELMKLSEGLRSPGQGELHRLCEGVFGKVCKRCALSSVCWQSYYEESAAAVDEITKTLSQKSSLTYDDMPDYLRRRCRHTERILNQIGEGYADLIESAINKDKTDLFAMDYAAMAELLRENVESGGLGGQFIPDGELQKRAEKVFAGLGISYISLGAFGSRQKFVTLSGVDVGSVTVGGREIAATLSGAVGMTFGDPDFRFQGDFVTMTLSTLPIYKVTAAHSSQPRKGEAACGDQVRSFYGNGNYAYSLICDGMGSGPDAAAVSEIGAVLLQKMLAAGNSRSVSLKLLSNLLCSRAVECHTTVDLLEIDLFTGRAVFLKCGSAPSYLYRSGKLFRVDSKSLPVGIVKELSSEETPVELAQGDLIVMVSDGVGGLEDALWLPEMIAKGAKDPVSDLASAIRARAAVENRSSDDISVIVARLERCVH